MENCEQKQHQQVPIEKFIISNLSKHWTFLMARQSMPNCETFLPQFDEQPLHPNQQPWKVL